MSSPNCPIPSTINPLSPTGFRLSINKLPEVSYFCQEASIPGMSLDPVPTGTPYSTLYNAGEILSFNELTVFFIVDQNMANYKAIHNWLIGLGFPDNYDQYRDLVADSNAGGIPKFGDQQGNFSDGLLEILGGNNLAVATINFRDLVPVAISTLTFKSDVDDVQYLTGSASFKYTYYDFV